MNNASSNKEREKTIFTGILSGSAARMLVLVAPFVVMPKMLQYLGSHIFGVWLTAVSITSMAAFVDLGIGNGVLSKITKARELNDNDLTRSYISNAYAALSALALALTLGLLAWFFISGYFSQEAQQSRDSSLVVFVCITTFLISVPASVIQRVMYACQKIWLSNLWQITASAIAVILCLLAIELELKAWQVVLAYSIPLPAFMAASALWFFNKNPEIKPSFRDLSISGVKELSVVGSQFFLLSIITSLALNADNVLIAKVLGPDSVTEYAVPAKVASLLGLAITTIFIPLWPANAAALARKEYEWVRRSTIRMSIIGVFLIVVMAIPMIIFGDQITSIWMGRTFEGYFVIVSTYSLFYLIMAATSPFNMVMNGLNVVDRQIKPWFLFLVLSLPLKYFLLKKYSLELIPLVSFAAYLFTVSYFIVRAVIKNNYGQKWVVA